MAERLGGEREPDKAPAQYSQIDGGVLAQLAGGEAASLLSAPTTTSGGFDDLSLAPATIKFTEVLLDDKQIPKTPITAKISMEIVQLASDGLTNKKPKVGTTTLFNNEQQYERIAKKGPGIASSLKMTLKTSVAYEKLLVFGQPIDLKFLEASVDNEQAEKAGSVFSVVPKLDLVKASSYFSLKAIPQFAALAKQFGDNFDVRIKVELSVKLSAVVPDADRAGMTKLIDKIDDAAKKLDDWEKTTGKVLDESEEVGKKLRSSGLRKGRFHKDPGLAESKRALRQIAKELEEEIAEKAGSRMSRAIVNKVVQSRISRVVAKVALKTMTKLTRLIPIVGWVLFAFDVLELAWLGYNVAVGRATFLGGGDSISLTGDIWNGMDDQKPGDAVPVSEDKEAFEKTPFAKLPEEDQAKLTAGTPIGRLIKGIVAQYDGGELEPAHLQRLFRIAAERQLTDAQVTAILTRVRTTAPRSSPDRVLDMLEKILADLSRVPTIDTDGDGKLDGVDTNGDGRADRFDTNGDGVLDGVDKDGDGKADGKSNDGKADGKSTGNGKTKSNGNGTATTTEQLPRLDVVIDDPIRSGLIVIEDTSGGLSDPVATDQMIETVSGVVRCLSARYRGGVGPRVFGSDGDIYFEVIAELVVATSRKGVVKTQTIKRTFGYCWRASTGRFGRMRPMESVDVVVVRTVKKKLTAGSNGSVDFKILKQTRIQGGVNVEIEITRIDPGAVVAREVGGKMKEYEVGQRETVRVYDSELR